MSKSAANPLLLPIAARWLPSFDSERASVGDLCEAFDALIDRARSAGHLISNDPNGSKDTRVLADHLFWIACEAREYLTRWNDLEERADPRGIYSADPRLDGETLLRRRKRHAEAMCDATNDRIRVTFPEPTTPDEAKASGLGGEDLASTASRREHDDFAAGVAAAIAANAEASPGEHWMASQEQLAFADALAALVVTVMDARAALQVRRATLRAFRGDWPRAMAGLKGLLPPSSWPGDALADEQGDAISAESSAPARLQAERGA